MKKTTLISALIFFMLILPAMAEKSKFTISGYGELHYNHKKADGKTSNKLDFHRFVLFFGHQWSEKWSFHSEIELEHNYVKSGQGELELEQAYVQYTPNDFINFRAGVILPDVGLLNTMHEPPLFLSVERPDYNKYIIPTTWFGNGAVITATTGDLRASLTIMEGLKEDSLSLSSGIRGARQKGFKSDVNNPLFSLAINYTGIPGLYAGGSYTSVRTSMDGEKVDVKLYEAHFKYEAHNIHSVLEIGKIDYSNGVLRESTGFYFDLGYNIGSLFNTEVKIIPWVRYTVYNTASEAQGVDDKAYRVKKWLAGVSVKPISSVVIKGEYGIEKKGIDEKKTNYLNFGVGYMF